MKLRARWRGREVMAHRLSDNEWEEMRTCSRKHGGTGLLMRCCGARAVPKHTPGGKRRYFAHFGKAETCTWVGETEMHLEAKLAALAAATSMGWNAAAEVSRAEWLISEGRDGAAPSGDDQDWQADVLAVRGGKRKVRIAIEIQRSAQAPSKTQFRDDRYEADGILPFWIFSPGFRSSKQKTRWKFVLPKGDGSAVAAAVNQAVSEFLALVESQNRIAAAVITVLREMGLTYVVHHLHNLPVMVRAQQGNRFQDILIAEIGAYTVREDETPEQLAGAQVIFVAKGEQPKGAGVVAHFIRSTDTLKFVRERLAAIFDGRLVWRCRDHIEDVPAALVGYDDTCPSCKKGYHHVLGCIVGHTQQRSDHRPRFVSVADDAEYVREAIKAFEQLWRKPCSEIGSGWHRYLMCPHCRVEAKSPFRWDELPGWPGLDGVPAWPYQRADLVVEEEVPGRGWQSPTTIGVRRLPPAAVWESFILGRIAARDERRRREEEEWERSQRERRERADRQRQEEEAAEQAELAARQEKLVAVIDTILSQADPNELAAWDRATWLAQRRPDLDGRSPAGLVKVGGGGFERLLESLGSLTMLRAPRRSIPGRLFGLPLAKAVADAAFAAGELRLSDLRRSAISYFGGEAEADDWLAGPNDACGGRCPGELARESLSGFNEAKEVVEALLRWQRDRAWRQDRLRKEANKLFCRADPRRVTALIETPCREVGMRRMMDLCDDEDGLRQCLDALRKIHRARPSL